MNPYSDVTLTLIINYRNLHLLNDKYKYILKIKREMFPLLDIAFFFQANKAVVTSKWSSTSMPSSFPASTSLLVTLISSIDG